MSNSRRLTTPRTPILGQIIDRCIKICPDSQTVFVYWIWNVNGGCEIRPQPILPDVNEKARRQHSPFCSEVRIQQDCRQERSEWCNIKINLSRFTNCSHTGFETGMWNSCTESPPPRALATTRCKWKSKATQSPFSRNPCEKETLWYVLVFYSSCSWRSAFWLISMHSG